MRTFEKKLLYLDWETNIDQKAPPEAILTALKKANEAVNKIMIANDEYTVLQKEVIASQKEVASHIANILGMQEMVLANKLWWANWVWKLLLAA